MNITTTDPKGTSEGEMNIITTYAGGTSEDIKKPKPEKMAPVIPDQVMKFMLSMKRRDRRAWHRQNKKKFNLPEWGELKNLKLD